MKVSVVIATRNAERTLERCLATVRDQNFPHIEVVVVDNLSTDATLAVAESLADVVLRAGPERSAQRNTGAQAASGEVLVFLDADMLLEPGVVREAVGHLSSPTTSGVIIPERSFGDGFWARCKALEKRLALNEPAVEAARAFRKVDFSAANGYDEHLTACEDWDLADRIDAADDRTTARTGSLVWHDEGKLRLRGTFDKKRYYGRWVSAWLRMAPAHRRRRSIAAKLPVLLRQPVTAGGLVIMKLVEATGFAVGMCDAVLSRSRDQTHRRDRRVLGRGPMLGTLAAVLLATASVQSWFQDGRFVAAGDNGLWLRGVRGTTRSWTDSLVGTGSSGYPSAGLVEGVLHDVLTAAGLSDPAAQRIWYTIVVAAAAASVAYLASAFTRQPMAVGAAGAVVVLAPFHITTLPNILPLIAITTLALIFGIAARLAQRRSVPAAYGALIAVWISPLSKNPPLLALALASAVVAAVAVIAVDRSTVRRLASFGAWFLAGSTFWLIPSLLHYGLGTPGLNIVAQTNIDAWSWTQRHSGPANVVTLVASWVWGDPHALPATASLARLPWSVLRWALPALVLVSVRLAANRRLAVVLGVATGAFVVLSIGVNPPFTGLNRFLNHHVPGFWLFRQPMAKFGVALVILYALLIAFGVDGLIQRRPSWSPALRRGMTVLVASLAACGVAFAHPLYTGTVVPGQRGGVDSLPPARVALPASWTEAGRWLDDAPLPGSVVVLPLSEYYQRGTTWGYYGVDDLMWRVTRRRALYLLPGGYFAPAGSAPNLMIALEDAVALRDDTGVGRLMEALGASYLAIRTDYRSTPGRNFRNGTELVAAATGNTKLHQDKGFEHVQIYSLANSERRASPAEIDVSRGTSLDRLADVVASTGSNAVIVDDDGQPGSADAWRPTNGQTSHTFPVEAGTYRVSVRPRTPPVWRATSFTRGDVRGVSVTLASTMKDDSGDLVALPAVEVSSPAEPMGIEVDGEILPIQDSPVLFEAAGGSTINLLVEGAAMTPESDGTRLGNCNNNRGLSVSEAGISSSPAPQGVTLSAVSGSACLLIPVTSRPTPLGRPMWRVRADFERLSGTTTRVCLWLPRATSCAAGNPTAITDQAGSFDFIAAPSPGQDPEGASLFLYADHQDGVDVVPAVIKYTNVSAAPIEAFGRSSTLPRLGTVSESRIFSQGNATFTASSELSRNILGHISPEVGDCHNYDNRPATDNQLSARSLPGEADQAIELAARRHSACASGQVDVPGRLRHLSLRFDYRGSTNFTGRWGLTRSDGTIVAGGPLPPSKEWKHFSKDVVLPRTDQLELSGAGPYRFYLYSDGAGVGEQPRDAVVTKFRAASIRPTYPMVAIAQPTRRRSAGSVSRTDDRNSVVSADGPTLIVHQESFADGWAIEGLPPSVSADHIMVDGWANGWRVDRLHRLSNNVSFDYRPDRIASIAVWSVVPVLLAALIAIHRSRRRPLVAGSSPRVDPGPILTVRRQRRRRATQ